MAPPVCPAGRNRTPVPAVGYIIVLSCQAIVLWCQGHAVATVRAADGPADRDRGTDRRRHPRAAPRHPYCWPDGITDAADWLGEADGSAGLPLATFGASTGAAAAPITAADRSARSFPAPVDRISPAPNWAAYAPTRLIVGRRERPSAGTQPRRYSPTRRGSRTSPWYPAGCTCSGTGSSPAGHRLIDRFVGGGCPPRKRVQLGVGWHARLGAHRRIAAGLARRRGSRRTAGSTPRRSRTGPRRACRDAGDGAGGVPAVAKLGAGLDGDGVAGCENGELLGGEPVLGGQCIPVARCASKAEGRIGLRRARRQEAAVGTQGCRYRGSWPAPAWEHHEWPQKR